MFVKGGSDTAFAKNKLQSVLKEEAITLDVFNTLRLTDVNKLSPEQVLKMKNIRDAVPIIDNTTMVQKTIPFEDIEKYIGDDGYDSIGGYIARYDDVSHISGYDNVIESSRLDYVKADGSRPYPEGGNKYGYIKFRSNDTGKIDIPYGEIFGRANTDGAPCTLNSFTGARNGEIIPEWTVNGYMKPKVGAELHKVIGSKDSIIAIFDGKHFREVSK